MLRAGWRSVSKAGQLVHGGGPPPHPMPQCAWDCPSGGTQVQPWPTWVGEGHTAAALQAALLLPRRLRVPRGL